MASLPRLLQLSGSTTRERNGVVSDLQEAIRAVGGWIVDFSLFSNISVCIVFTTAAHRLAGLLEALKETGVKLEAKGLAATEAIAQQAAAAGVAAELPEFSCTLQVTFIHSDPDLRREVPSIPG
jgi:hypothetical protein